MAMLLDANDVRVQSQAVWKQFGESLWIPNAKKNAMLKHHDMRKFEHAGVGKFAVLVGMGASLEDNIDAIKQHREKIDVICCDKAFGPLLDHGVKADFVVIADAGIPFRYIEKWIDQTEGVKLFATPYANTEWTHAWKGPIHYYVNQDAIESEKVFKPIMGDCRVIPASSNVSNAMVVLWTDCNGKKNENWGGYERYYLVGYDYSWQAKGNYYSWQHPMPKANYMKHRTLVDITNNCVFTSENLIFSAKWLVSYITTFELPVVNCAGRGLLEIPMRANLAKELARIQTDSKITSAVRESFEAWKESFKTFKKCENNFNRQREELLWL
jgi:hypothetical protein